MTRESEWDRAIGWMKWVRGERGRCVGKKGEFNAGLWGAFRVFYSNWNRNIKQPSTPTSVSCAFVSKFTLKIIRNRVILSINSLLHFSPPLPPPSPSAAPKEHNRASPEMKTKKRDSFCFALPWKMMEVRDGVNVVAVKFLFSFLPFVHFLLLLLLHLLREKQSKKERK